jgi:hypothetical protein
MEMRDDVDMSRVDRRIVAAHGRFEPMTWYEVGEADIMLFSRKQDLIDVRSLTSHPPVTISSTSTSTDYSVTQQTTTK